ncbi:MAG: B12-binding domain-containing radical SAM protein [Candidatus Riflebacteria bacterium]|nr:B12-binding domain-containing radical SAM protein [Candidatus Riflebacteria bacterium]
MKALLLYPQQEDSYWGLNLTRRLAGVRGIAPPLALLTVAASLPQSWELRLCDANLHPPTDEDWAYSDLVLISSILPQRRACLELVRAAKARGKTVVVGGLYPWALPQELVDAGADHVVQGESEAVVPLLLEALSSGRRGVISAPEAPSLESSPAPRFDLVTVRDYAYVVLQTTRGCPHDCEFCNVVSLYGRRVRAKPPAQVLQEFEALYRTGYRGHVFIGDDNFIGSRPRALQLLAAIKQWQWERGEPFGLMVQATVDLGRDLEMIDALTAANVGPVFIGFESTDEKVLAGSDKVHNLRQDPGEMVRTICANGLTVVGSFIVGLDGEPPGASGRVIRFLEETAVPTAMFSLLRSLPGTRLAARLEREGRALDTVPASAASDCLDLNYVPQRPVAEILQEFADLWRQAYEPSAVLARAYRYYRRMRPTRAAQAKQEGRPLAPKAAPARGPVPLDRRDLVVLCWIVWQEGFLRSTRFQFWRQLLGMAWHNRSRVDLYLMAAATAEEMISMRGSVLASHETWKRAQGGSPGPSVPDARS